MNVIGIDPGGKGGIAVIPVDRRGVRTYDLTDLSPFDIYKILLGESLTSCQVFLEKVHGLPGMGGTYMFTFGRNFGHIEMALTAIGMPFEWAPPQTWQKKLGLGGAKGTYTQRKKAHKQLAEQWFPGVKVNLANADALLIAEYGHRTLFRV